MCCVCAEVVLPHSDQLVTWLATKVSITLTVCLCVTDREREIEKGGEVDPLAQPAHTTHPHATQHTHTRKNWQLCTHKTVYCVPLYCFSVFLHARTHTHRCSN